MGLMDELASEPSGPAYKCPVKLVADKMTPDDAADLLEAVDGNVIAAMAIARVLWRKEIRLPAAAITRHRRHECSCRKS